MTTNIELSEGLLANQTDPIAEQYEAQKDRAALSFLKQYTLEETKSFYDSRRSIMKNVCLFLFVLLPFWQVPFWCSEESYEAYNCAGTKTSTDVDADENAGPDVHYMVSGINYLKPKYYLILEAVLIVIILFCLKSKKVPENHFNYQLYLAFPLMAFCLFDTVATYFVGYYRYPNYFTSVIRPFVFIINSNILRSIFWKILRIVVEARRVFAYLIGTIVFFAWLTTLRFPESQEFGSLGNSIYIFITLLDGENFPGVIQGPYSESKGYAFFFFLYMMIGIYIIMGLLLAVFYTSFHNISREERVQNAQDEFKYIKASWNALTAHESEADKKTLTKKQLLSFFNSLRAEKYATNALKLKSLPDSRNDEVIYRVLDRNDDGTIDADEFERFCVLIKMVNDLPDLEGADKVAKYDRCLGFIRAYLTNPYVELFYLIITIGNIALLYYITEFDKENAEWWIFVQLGVCLLYIIEVVFALLGGANSYLNSIHHILETIMSGWSLFLILDAIWDNDDTSAINWIQYFALIRMFRVFRLLLNIEEWNLLFVCIQKALPLIFKFFIGIFALFYIYAVIGEISFGGRQENKTAENHDYLYNYNDFAEAMASITIFLFAPWYPVVEKNEAETIDGIDATPASTKVFYVLLYFTTVLLVSNIVIPIVFGIFDFEYKQHKELKKCRAEYPEAEPLEFFGKKCKFSEKEFEIVIEREFLRRKGEF